MNKESFQQSDLRHSLFFRFFHEKSTQNQCDDSAFFTCLLQEKKITKQPRSITTPIGSLRVKFNMIMALQGTKNRTIAATNMNATSSRAHTIVAINFTQKTDVCSYSQFFQILVLLLLTLFILYL